MNMVNGAFNDDAFHRKKAGGAGPGGQGCQKALLGVSENGDSHRMASDLFMAKQCIPMDLIYIYICTRFSDKTNGKSGAIQGMRIHG